MSASPLSHNLTRSFGVLLALLLFLVAFSMFNFRSLSEANRLNIHTYQVINGTLQLEGTLFAIDSGVRGYLVAGEQSALNSYRTNLRLFDQRLADLTALASDNLTQVENFQDLKAGEQKWNREILAPLVARRQQLTDPKARLAIATASSLRRRRALADLQKVTDQITAVEEQLLAERTDNQKRVNWWTRVTLLGGSGFSILLTVFLVSFASKSARWLAETNALLNEAKIKAETTNVQLLETNAQLETEITARRLADEKLRRSVLDLQRSNAELEQFAYVASHDLQEPLRAVGGCVQVLQRRYADKLDERADQFIQHAVDGAQRMQTLINDLLAYSRVGTRTIAFQPIEGRAIVEAALRNVSVAREESGAQVTIDPLPILICDAGQIEQVLQNLLSNALKFRGDTAPRIHIRYATRSEGPAPFHVLSVEDEGVGIEPQYFARIFVMFQRLHTRTEYSGTGIGLAICKKIIERHGGQIWVESWRAGDEKLGETPKHGSKFSFSLPFEPETNLDAFAIDTPASGAETARESAPPSLK